MEQAQGYILMLAQIVGVITIVATVIVRLTPSKTDDDKVKMLSSTLWRYINMLPTIGMNPRTKKLEEAYKEMLTNA